MAYCVPLRFVRLGPDVAICATRIIAVMSTASFQARQSIKSQKRNGTLINACGRSKCLSAVFLDNGSVVSSPFSVTKIVNALDRANDKELNPKAMRQSSKIRIVDKVQGEDFDELAYEMPDMDVCDDPENEEDDYDGEDDEESLEDI